MYTAMRIAQPVALDSVARGDIGNEKTPFSPYPGRGQTQRRTTLILYDLCIIIIIIIVINCNWVITRWQWLYYMYTNMGGKKSN
jgi:hypothetical protein